MHLSTTGLMQLLHKNVVELRFTRRHYKEGFKMQRRMLCTNDATLLLSEAGKKILNYTVPTQSRKYNPAAKSLVSAYDIFMQQYRMIDVRTCDVIAVIPSQPPEKWWEYFNNKVINMSASQ